MRVQETFLTVITMTIFPACVVDVGLDIGCTGFDVAAEAVVWVVELAICIRFPLMFITIKFITHSIIQNLLTSFINFTIR